MRCEIPAGIEFRVGGMVGFSALYSGLTGTDFGNLCARPGERVMWEQV
jgi:hypothetical protein